MKTCQTLGINVASTQPRRLSARRNSFGRLSRNAATKDARFASRPEGSVADP
jgi:hypothetical protein